MKMFFALTMLLLSSQVFANDDVFGPAARCPRQGCTVGYSLLNFKVSKIEITKDRAAVSLAATESSNLSHPILAHLRLPEDQMLLLVLTQQGSDSMAKVLTAGNPNQGFADQRITAISIQK